VRRKIALVCLLGFGSLPPGRLVGQTTAGPALPESLLVRDARVRTTIGSVQREFRLVELRADTIVVREALGDSVRPIVLATKDLDRLEVSARRVGGSSGFWKGARIGVLAGAVMGALIGLAEGDDNPGIVTFQAEEKAMIYGVLLGGVAGLVGGFIGSSQQADAWLEVPLPLAAPR
jgi:hypothetical protein